MFIASKYEDVVPLIMKTVVHKISHNKFDVKQIEKKELEILTAVGFKVGAPTVKEFLDRFIEETGYKALKAEKFTQTCSILSKLCCYNYSLMQMPTSLLASSILSIALHFHAKSLPFNPVDYQSIIKLMNRLGNHSESDLLTCGSELWNFVKDFEKLHPGVKNLKDGYKLI